MTKSTDGGRLCQVSNDVNAQYLQYEIYVLYWMAELNWSFLIENLPAGWFSCDGSFDELVRISALSNILSIRA